MNERASISGSDIVAVFVILSIAATVVFFVALVFYDLGLDSGTGEQIGYISEVETNGWIWKTTEIKLISVEPVYSDSDTSYHFASPNKEMTELARKYMRTHETVVVKYEVWQAAPRWEQANRVPAVDIVPA